MSSWRDRGLRERRVWDGQTRLARLIACSAFSAAVCFQASFAFAAGGGHEVNLHPEINWWSWDMDAPPIGWFLINFILFIVVMRRLVGPAMSRLFAARSSQIRDAIEVNERELEQAQAERATWQNRIADIEHEVEDLLAKSRSDGEAEKTKIIENATGYAARMRSDTDLIVKQEVRAAERMLQLEISRQALDSAESLLRKVITDADRERLFNDAISELAQGGPSLKTDRRAGVG